MQEPKDRLAAVRKAAGFKSPTDAARYYGWNEVTYRAHENGERGLRPAPAAKYARAFKTTPEWLLYGRGKPQKRLAKAEGVIGAGAQIIPLDELPIDPEVREIELPPTAPENVHLVTVQGDSMLPRYFGGERLFYLKTDRPPDDFIGRECIVELADGRVLVKELRRGSKRGLFTLRSLNASDIEDQKVRWAAPIKWTERP